MKKLNCSNIIASYLNVNQYKWCIPEGVLFIKNHTSNLVLVIYWCQSYCEMIRTNISAMLAFIKKLLIKPFKSIGDKL